MGLFSRKPDLRKEYSLSEAMYLEEFEGYTLVETKPGDVSNISYKYMTNADAKRYLEEYKRKETSKERAQSFNNRINGNGSYMNLSGVSQYNRYENVTSYQKDFTR